MFESAVELLVLRLQVQEVQDLQFCCFFHFREFSRFVTI